MPDRYYEKFKDLPVHYRDNVPEEMRTEKLETITRQYFAAVNGIDEQFGRIMEYLKEQGLEEDTLVVLSADHGEMLGSHGLMSKNIWYEESVHIPLMMRQKGRITPGENGELFASPDHMPTLLDLLNLPVPETCQGYSHKKGMFAADENAPEDMFLCSYPGGAEMVVAFEKCGLTHKAYGWRGVKTHRYTYVVSNGYAPGEETKEYLYDDANDKYQLNPRMIEADSEEKLILEFRKKLKNYLELTQDPFLLIGGR